MRWNTASFSNIGRRKLNDDAIGFRHVKAYKKSYWVLVAADGVGSAKGSGSLSKLVTQMGLFSIENFLRSRATKRDINSKDIKKMITCLNYDLQKINLERRLATTFVCAVLGKRTIAVTWVGDSRAYAIYCDGKMHVLTQDHATSDGSICRFVSGDGKITGKMDGCVFSADNLQLLSVVTDGVYNACTESELCSFFLYSASCLNLSSEKLCKDFAEFSGSNISDNATMSVLLNPRRISQIQKVAYLKQMETNEYS